MTEIVETRAGRLSTRDALTLIVWRNCHSENLVEGFNMQGLLDLYHRSTGFQLLDQWLDSDARAIESYANLRRRSSRYQEPEHPFPFVANA